MYIYICIHIYIYVPININIHVVQVRAYTFTDARMLCQAIIVSLDKRVKCTCAARVRFTPCRTRTPQLRHTHKYLLLRRSVIEKAPQRSIFGCFLFGRLACGSGMDTREDQKSDIKSGGNQTMHRPEIPHSVRASQAYFAARRSKREQTAFCPSNLSQCELEHYTNSNSQAAQTGHSRT